MHKKYPAKNSTTPYPVPKKNVLFISCIDLRLTDDLTRFMDSDNLTNRYDHYIMAGTSLAFAKAKSSCPQAMHGAGADFVPDWDGWMSALMQHIEIAIDLHDIHDIYIVEHENCGAYKYYALECGNELDCQRDNSSALAAFLHNYYRTRPAKPKDISTHAFHMDIRGDVMHIVSCFTGKVESLAG